MIEIDGESLRIEDVIKVARGKEEVVLAKKAMEKINKCREKVEKIIDEGKIAYGINTGVGELSNVRISLDEIEKLQQNLVRSHSCAVGEELPEEVVRAMMLLRMNSLAKGYSGVTLNLVEKLGMALNKNFHPVVPSQGSVGASGDLAPLAHIALAFMGEGMVNFNGRKVPAMEALEEAEIGAIRYKAKEGLALINGTQMMTAIACLGIYDSLMLLKNAQIAGVMSLEALKGTDQAFREEIQNARPYEGQIKCAKNLWKLTRESDIIASHKTCPKVQDAYTLRCMPQVFGAIWDSLNYVKKILEVEINSATDNPLIFPDQDKVISQAQAAVNSAWLAYQATIDGIVKAPIGGVVANLSVSLGQEVSSDDIALLINSGAEIWIKLAVSEADVITIKPGQAAIVEVDALRGSSFNAIVKRVDEFGTDNSGIVTYNIYLVLIDSVEMIKPTMTVQVDITTQNKDDAFIVPNSAIKPYQGSKAVQILSKKTGQAIYVPIEIGIEGESFTEVVNGLKEGQEVIIGQITNDDSSKKSKSGGIFPVPGGGAIKK